MRRPKAEGGGGRHRKSSPASAAKGAATKSAVPNGLVGDGKGERRDAGNGKSPTKRSDHEKAGRGDGKPSKSRSLDVTKDELSIPAKLETPQGTPAARSAAADPANEMASIAGKETVETKSSAPAKDGTPQEAPADREVVEAPPKPLAPTDTGAKEGRGDDPVVLPPENVESRAGARRALRQRAIIREGRKASLAAKPAHLHDRRGIRALWRASLGGASKAARREMTMTWGDLHPAEVTEGGEVWPAPAAGTPVPVSRIRGSRHTASSHRVATKENLRWKTRVSRRGHAEAVAKGEYEGALERLREISANTLNDGSAAVILPAQHAQELYNAAEEVSRTSEALSRAQAGLKSDLAAASEALGSYTRFYRCLSTVLEPSRLAMVTAPSPLFVGS